MRKYNYRAQNFQKVNWDQLREQTAGERLILAIDVAKKDFYVALMKPDRTVLKTIRWEHPQQSPALLRELANLKAQRLEAVMEPTGTYGDALRYQLRALGAEIYRVSPKRVHDAAEVYDGVPSLHDAKAAYLIGRLHLDGISQRWREPSEARRALRALLNRLEQVQERHQRALNRLEALLARHWPEALCWLTLQSASLLHLLAEYGDPARGAGQPEQADQLLRRVGRHMLKASKREGLLRSAVTTLGVPVVETEHELIRALAQEMLDTRAQSRELERALSERVEHTRELAWMAEALGHNSAVVLYCALGSANDYPRAASYLKAAGLNLKERSSGKHKGQLKLTKRGPGVVRHYLYFAALRLIRKSGPARAWYDAKLARHRGPKGKLIIALMRKLAKALWHVAQGKPFDPARLFTEPRQVEMA